MAFLTQRRPPLTLRWPRRLPLSSSYGAAPIKALAILSLTSPSSGRPATRFVALVSPSPGTLHRHYPASSVLRAHPTPHRARPGLHKPPVDLSLDRAMGSPVLPRFSLCTCRRPYPGGAAGCLSLSSP